MSTGKWFAVSRLFPPLLVLVSVPALDAASFEGVGYLPGKDRSKGRGVSADGSVVTGVSSISTSPEAFRWTSEGGMVGLGELPGGDAWSSARAVSANGFVVVGQCNPASSGLGEAFRWTYGSGTVRLGDLAGGPFRSDARAASADGSVVVGVSESALGTEAFRWTQSGGMTGLGDLPGGLFFSYATGISADGSTVVGWGNGVSGREAFAWTSENGMVGLGYLDGFVDSSALAISADGSTVVGSSGAGSFDFPFIYEAFLWTSRSGMVDLGRLPGAVSSHALAVSADGSVVVGSSGPSGSPEAFIWDAANGMQDLQDVLTGDFGLDLTGWTLSSAYDISDDGRVIVGWGRNPSGETEAWRAVIPEPSSVLLAVIGVVTLLACRWCKRRQR